MQKCGTAWWYRLLTQHPGVMGAPRKELHFFDDFATRELQREDIAEYASWFARPPGVLGGEWTPRYLYDFWTPGLLRRVAPDAKLLVLLRDPVDRYRSGVTHEAPSTSRRPLAPVASAQFARGFYHRQLTNLLHHFPREQVLVLQFERCIAVPRAEMTRTLEFLGLDPTFEPDYETTATHRTTRPKVVVPCHVTEELRVRYREDITSLFAGFPELDPSLWPTAHSVLS